MLAFGQVEGDCRGDHIRQPARFGDVHGKEMGFFGDGPVQLDAAVEQVQGIAHQRLGGFIGRGRFFDHPRPHLEDRCQAGEFHHLHPPPSLHQCRGGAVRHRKQPSDRHFHADGQEILRPGIFQIRIALGQADDGPVVLVRFLDRQQAGLARHKYRRDHVRKNNDVPQRQHQRFDAAILIRRGID